MNVDEAISYFGDRKKMAENLGVSLYVTYRWDKKLPMLRQFQIERMSDGKLKADA